MNFCKITGNDVSLSATHEIMNWTLGDYVLRVCIDVHLDVYYLILQTQVNQKRSDGVNNGPTSEFYQCRSVARNECCQAWQSVLHFIQ